MTHAAGLTVIGVGAIVALILQIKARMGPHGTPEGLLRAASAGNASVKLPDNLPHVVFGDPFTHPVLVRRAMEEEKKRLILVGGSNGVEPNGKARQATKPGIIPGRLDFSPILPQVSGPIADLDHGSGDKSAKVGVVPSSDDPKAPKGRLIMLQAVVAATSPVAFISVDGKEPQQYGVGDSIAKGIRISRITETEVVIASGQTQSTLHVGDKVQL